MPVFRYVDLGDISDLQTQILSWAGAQGLLDTVISWQTLDHCLLAQAIPQLVDTVSSLGDIDRAALIQRPPGFQGGIHCDSGRKPRLLLPVARCEGSETRFFAVDHHCLLPSQGLLGDQFFAVPGSALGPELARADLSRPIVFDPKVAHGIWTNPRFSLPRITLTLGFRETLII